MILVLSCIWHAIIASVVFINTVPPKPVGPHDIYTQVDRYVFYIMIALYALIHILFVIWLIVVPYKRRREMEYLDREYAAKKYIELDSSRSRYDPSQSPPPEANSPRSGFTLSNPPMMKSSVAPTKQPDKALANGTVFLPIEEETKTRRKAKVDFSEVNESDEDVK